MLTGTAFAHERITVTNAAAVSLTASLYSPTGEGSAVRAMITISGEDDVRYRIDGVDPTTAVGHLYLSTTFGDRMDTPIILRSLASIQNFRVIAPGAPAAVIVSYFR